MYEPSVSVTWLKFEPGDVWHAVFMETADGKHQMFEGSREDCIAWGFERCPLVKVYVPGESRWEVVRAAG
jgi:hypothetical protein